MDQLIKVFGERNTGTRAVLAMLDAAEGVQGVAHEGVADEELEPFEEMIREVEAVYSGPWKRIYREAIKDIRAETLGPLGTWKHAAPLYDPAYREAGISTVFLVRNPYSWIVSLYERPYHNMGKRGGALEAFLRFPWLTVGRDNVDRILPSPMLLWPLKLRAYAAFAEAAKADGVATATIRFEDFVQFPAQTLNRAMGGLGLKPEGLKAFARSTKPRGKQADQRRSYYASEEWRADLTAPAVRIINDIVDWELAEVYGYSRLDPASFPDVQPISDREGRAAATA